MWEGAIAHPNDIAITSMSQFIRKDIKTISHILSVAIEVYSIKEHSIIQKIELPNECLLSTPLAIFFNSENVCFSLFEEGTCLNQSKAIDENIKMFIPGDAYILPKDSEKISPILFEECKDTLNAAESELNKCMKSTKIDAEDLRNLREEYCVEAIKRIGLTEGGRSLCAICKQYTQLKWGILDDVICQECANKIIKTRNKEGINKYYKCIAMYNLMRDNEISPFNN